MKTRLILFRIIILTIILITTAAADTKAEGITFGVEGMVNCWNCYQTTARIYLTYYTPQAGGINCWDYSNDYCNSTTASGIPWESVYGFSAACPIDWKFGTWVIIPEIGIAIICLDRGGAIRCNEQGVCNVDVLSDYIPQAGYEYDAILLIPGSGY